MSQPCSTHGELKGIIIKGRERIQSWAAMQALGCDMKQIKPLMNSLGWQGPIKARALDASGKPSVISCYERDPQYIVGVDGEHLPDVVVDELPAKLEQFTGESLDFLRKLVRYGFHPSETALTRSQVTAALGGISAQQRADEQRLRVKRDGDVLAKLLKIIENERKSTSLNNENERKGQPRGDHSKRDLDGDELLVGIEGEHLVPHQPVKAIDHDQADGDGEPHEGTETLAVIEATPE